jgi:hypothetical protein
LFLFGLSLATAVIIPKITSGFTNVQAFSKAVPLSGCLGQLFAIFTQCPGSRSGSMTIQTASLYSEEGARQWQPYNVHYQYGMITAGKPQQQ